MVCARGMQTGEIRSHAQPRHKTQRLIQKQVVLRIRQADHRNVGSEPCAHQPLCWRVDDHAVLAVDQAHTRAQGVHHLLTGPHPHQRQ
jgi:hypothetical protein